MKIDIFKLKEGNRKFANGEMFSLDLKSQIEMTSRNQNPHTVVVTCYDSRVVPEYIFTCGLGELFVVRIAGNVLDRISLETIEFAVSSFEIKHIVIMGHTNCGGITAVISENSNETRFEGLFQNIKQIVEESKSRFKGENDILNYVIKANVLFQVKLLMGSEIISEKVRLNKITIIPALYNLETDFVEFFNFLK